MQVGPPGNVDKGFCLKCKTPLVVELPDKIRYLCPSCVKEVKEKLAHAKGNKNLKRIVLQPGQWHQRLPDGRAMPLRKKQRAKRR